MDRKITPAKKLGGTIQLPGDKSISHRCAMLAAVAEGKSELSNYSTGADCASTLSCLEALGVPIRREGTRVEIDGVGLRGLRAAEAALDAGNSGSTIRMLAGILAGQPFTTEIAGDESLARRPMKRVIAPLTEMGARIEARREEFPPLKITGGELRSIRHEPPVASAQVKTAVLLAGLYAAGRTTVVESIPTRNHSEIALRAFGADLAVEGAAVSIQGPARLEARAARIPSDLSSAAFFIGAGLLTRGAEIRIEGVGLNPTRTALLDFLREMGADIEITPDPDADGEPSGTLIVRGPTSEGVSSIRGGTISGALAAAVIDEIPMLAVLGAASREGLLIRDAKELRVKETDRITAVVENLGRLGVDVAEFGDGMNIPGGQRFKGAELESFGDHRIAMAFTVAALAAGGESVMKGAEAASVSFPEFYETLESLL